MGKYRIPRKLKKGCRTINGNPRTKWQRKGKIQIRKMLLAIGDVSESAAICASALERLAASIRQPFPVGAIAVPTDPPKVGVAQMPTPELVVNHDQIAELKHVIDIDPMENLCTAVAVPNLTDVLGKTSAYCKQQLMQGLSVNRQRH